MDRRTTRLALLNTARTLLCLATAGLVGPGSAAAQAVDETFEEYTQVIEVEVPVNVVAKDGTPIRGLTADDFELYDNGKRQEITGFQVFDFELLEPGASRAEIEKAVPAGARRHFLFLFDLSFSAPGAVIRAREAAREFALSSLHPTDLAAVATHSVESGPELVVTFTPDRAQIARAIDTLGAPRMLTLARRDPLRFVIDNPSGFGSDAGSDVPDFNQDSTSSSTPTNPMTAQVMAHIRVVGKQIEKVEKSFERGRISSWSSSMGDLARYMDSVKGRKHVVYFSEGFDGRLLLGRQPSGEDRQGTMADMQNISQGNFWMVDTDDIYGNTGLQSEVAGMLEQFRRSDCVIQTVDISGLRADSAAEQRARRVGQDALFYLANETGGTLFEDANNFGEQLERLLERSAVTYLLTFKPSDLEADGSYHRLKVRANLQRGAQTSYRRGFYAPRPFEDLHPFEKNLLASSAIASAEETRDIELNVLVAPFKSSEASAYVPVIIEVSGASLLAGHEEDQLGVEFYTYVTDERGEMRDFFTQLVSLDLERSRDFINETGLKYYGHLDLAPGEHLIRVLVRNADTGRTGVAAAPVSIPAFADTEPSLLPPFFVESPGRWVLVRERRGEENQRSVVYPFTVNGEPYIPSAMPELRSHEEAQVCLVAYNLGEGALDVGGRIVAEDGREVEGGELSIIDRTVTGIEGLDKVLATFHPNGLQAGRYMLEVAVTDPETGKIRSNSIPFQIVLN